MLLCGNWFPSSDTLSVSSYCNQPANILATFAICNIGTEGGASEICLLKIFGNLLVQEGLALRGTHRLRAKGKQIWTKWPLQGLWESPL